MSLLSESEDEGVSEKSSDESEEDGEVYKPSKSVPTYFDESAQKKAPAFGRQNEETTAQQRIGQ